MIQAAQKNRVSSFGESDFFSYGGFAAAAASGNSSESRLRRLPQAGISSKVVCGGCRKREFFRKSFAAAAANGNFIQKSFAAAAASGNFSKNRLRRLPQAGIFPKVVCGGCRKQEFFQKSFAAAAANKKI
ncbi:MAG: hypothetical protein LBS54_01235 [Dysgonamonadaceae bacterium]|jgi:predicted nucleic-acid-binding Zn-ribbon protein|nr:hypothetical protein [Dysgonamonadaceae bacterium]